MRVAIYIRVSTTMQAEDGNSLKAQKNLLTQFAKLKNWEIVEIYEDEGLSAKNTNRPSFQRMIMDALEKKFDNIIVWKLSRFSRSLKDLVTTMELLDKADVSIISYSENIDLSSATGKLMFNIIGAFAQFERETLSENMSMSMRQAAFSGARNISHCYGYKVVDHQFIVVPEEAEIVNAIYDYYMEHQCIAETTRFANTMGYKGRRGNLMGYNSVFVILKNLTYTGYTTYKNFVPFKQRIVPQIVCDDKFDTVQMILKHKLPVSGKKIKTIDEWLIAKEPKKALY